MIANQSVLFSVPTQLRWFPIYTFPPNVLSLILPLSFLHMYHQCKVLLTIPWIQLTSHLKDNAMVVKYLAQVPRQGLEPKLC